MSIVFVCLVGMTGFEPAASSSRTKRATGLRYIPKWQSGKFIQMPAFIKTEIISTTKSFYKMQLTVDFKQDV